MAPRSLTRWGFVLLLSILKAQHLPLCQPIRTEVMIAGRVPVGFVLTQITMLRILFSAVQAIPKIAPARWQSVAIQLSRPPLQLQQLGLVHLPGRAPQPAPERPPGLLRRRLRLR